MKKYYFAEANTIQDLNLIINVFAKQRWISEGKLIIMCHKGEVYYIQKLVYKPTWIEYIKEKLCIN